MNFKKMMVISLAAFLAASALCTNVLAEDDSTAGIDFTKGNIIITPGPDPDLGTIKDANIYFGEQELSATTESYSSVTTHEDLARQYAGFVVTAANTDGWAITAQISGFKINGNTTMENFSLVLTPEQEDGAPKIVTTPGNTGIAPDANQVELAAKNDGDFGPAARIFNAEEGKGFGKWGCNWEGELTVIGGSVTQAGNATATILWTLNPENVQP